MNNINPIHFTKEKYEQIKKDYEKLLTERKETVVHLTKAREMGDLSENGYYRSSKMKLSSIDHNLRKLANFIKYGQIISTNNCGIVEIGSHVTIKNDQGIQQYQIVGKEETDPKLGKISNESPLGKLLLGKKTGENIELITPLAATYYTIIKIN